VPHLETARGRTGRARITQPAITTTTNDHVDAINHHIQQHSLEIGELGASIRLGDGAFHVGDIITTRHNQRPLPKRYQEAQASSHGLQLDRMSWTSWRPR
jgi:hypothetical protein